MSHLSAPWLTLVGLPAEGPDGLGRAARAQLREAELVVGSARQLALVAPLVRAPTYTWPSPFEAGIAHVLARRGTPTCVLASGDPFWYGVGATLSRALVPEELRCFPAPSSLSLAAARLGWPIQDVEVVSLHGRALSSITARLAPGVRVLAMSWDGSTPRALAGLLVAQGYGPSRVHVLEALGSPEERVHGLVAAELAELPRPFHHLNLVALELRSAAGVPALATRGCLPDHAFEHDGQLTKRDVRAVTLCALGPRPHALLWDVGAGSGSVAIEWLRAHPTCRAVAVERHSERAARIERNAARLGTHALRVVRGAAPEVLHALEAPDAVFVGGGVSDPRILDQAFAALGPRGTLVANAVSLAAQAELVTRHTRAGGELCQLSFAHAAPLGAFSALRPALPILQWRITKP